MPFYKKVVIQFEDAERQTRQGSCLPPSFSQMSWHAWGELERGWASPLGFSIFAAGVSKKKHQPTGWCFFLEAPPGFEPGVKDLQSHALPLGYGAKKWSGQRDSNSLPPPWQGGALPNELCPHFVNASVILPQKADLSSFFLTFLLIRRYSFCPSRQINDCAVHAGQLSASH